MTILDKAEWHVFMPDMDNIPKHITRGLLRDQFAYGKYGLWYKQLSLRRKGVIDKEISKVDVSSLSKSLGMKVWGLKELR